MGRILGGALPLFGGGQAGSPSNTMSLGSIASTCIGLTRGILMHPAVWPHQTWAAPFWGGSWVPIQYKVAWAEAYFHTKWHLDPSSRLATTNMGGKLEAVPPFPWAYRSSSNTKSPGRGLPPYQVASGSVQQFGRNRYGLKIGGLCLFGGRGAGFPSNTLVTWSSGRASVFGRCVFAVLRSTRS